MQLCSTIREIKKLKAMILLICYYYYYYRLAMAHSQNSISSNFNCRVLAIKQPTHHGDQLSPMIDSSTNLDFSHIDISTLQ